jgi:monofunctional biosynthetic peptidoglycan transglycosylase
VRLLARIGLNVVLLSALLTAPWRWLAPPTTSFMLQERYGVGGPAREVRYRWVGWDEISPHLKIAVVAAEDQKFPTHHGFDLQAISHALRDGDGSRRGASTISQQVAKNLFLWPGRSFVRKGLEAWFTLWIEGLWPKRRILEVYLNVAEFGPGVFGAEAAAARFFGTTAGRLSPEQAARLAAVLPAPKRWSAGQPSPYVRDRTQKILVASRRLGGSAYLSGL